MGGWRQVYGEMGCSLCEYGVVTAISALSALIR